MSKWPVLSAYSSDYTNGLYKVVNTTQCEGQIRIVHSVEGPNLITDLLKNGKATFAVEIASPRTIFRTFSISCQNSVTSLTQEVSWNPNSVREPILIRPLIIHTNSYATTIKLSSIRHRLHRAWDNIDIAIPPGAIIGQSNFFKPSGYISLLKMVRDDTGQLGEGAYRVETDLSDNYVFKVIMNKKLFENMQTKSINRLDHRDTLLTGALATGLAMLNRDFIEGNIEEIDLSQNVLLRDLHKILKDASLSTWEDDNFDSALAATFLKPIIFKTDEENG